MLKAMNEDEEGREKIRRKENEVNERLARDMEKRMRNEEAKVKAEADKRGKEGGGESPPWWGAPTSEQKEPGRR